MQFLKHIMSLISDEWEELKEKPLNFVSWFLGIFGTVGSPLLAVFKMIDYKIATIIEAIIILILFIRYSWLKSNSINLKDLYYSNVPIIAILSYFIKRRKRTEFNRMTMHTVLITYLYSKDSNTNGVFQTVTWRFEGKNETGSTVTRVPMMVSKSFSDNYQDIKISATDLETNSKLVIDDTDESGTQKYLHIIFNEEGILSGQHFNYEVTMQWLKPQLLIEDEFLILDPQNYSLKTDKINAIIKSDHKLLKEKPVTFFATNQKAVTFKHDEYNGYMQETDDEYYVCSRDFTAKKGKIYIIKIGISN